MAKQTRTGAYRCDSGFVAAGRKGQPPVRVKAGALVPYDHPYEVMDGREHLFTDISVPRGGVVEQATAGPGEKRSVRRRNKPAAEPAVDAEEPGEA